MARNGGADRFRAKTGLPLTTYFSGLKIRWILENVAGVRERAEEGDVLFGNIDSLLLWNLTGGPRGGLPITDCTNASRTQLMNLQTLNWDQELLEAFGVPAAMLPKIASSSQVYGTGAIEPLTGVPVAGILGDQQAPRWSGRPASNPARPRAPTARAASSWKASSTARSIPCSYRTSGSRTPSSWNIWCGPRCSGSFDRRRELAIQLTEPAVLHRLVKVVHGDWESSHSLDLTHEGLLADLESHPKQGGVERAGSLTAGHSE